MSNGNGNFQFLATRIIHGNAPRFEIADFNNDNKMDIMAIETGGLNHFEYIPGNGNGTFGTSIDNPISMAPISVVSDFNGDSYLDIASALFSDSLSILLGQGDGTFTKQLYYIGSGSHRLAGGDFNHDSYTDIVTTNYNTSTVSVLLGHWKW